MWLHVVFLLSECVVPASTVVQVTHPTVTLNHGGQVRGTAFNLNGSDIAVFYGIPYAKPPIGPLRFKKTKTANGWTGIKDSSTNHLVLCPQEAPHFSSSYGGQEDCLILDVYVPGGVDAFDEKKAVMVWIHGGSYLSGSGASYPMLMLAIEGDVVVVTVNYRLGALGFLTEAGDGNFGLWDIRQSLIWVQENIDKFGGDRQRVTLFGASAGGAAVSALTVSQQTSGLFDRAICQSGALYSTWSWGYSDRQRQQINDIIAKKFNCATDQSLFDCLGSVSHLEIVRQTSSLNFAGNTVFKPFSDLDFFDMDVDQQIYDASNRFDVMTGTTGQDGLMVLAAFAYDQSKGEISDGFTEKASMDLLKHMCKSLTPHNVELCAIYLYFEHDITAETDRNRALALTDLMTDMHFASESRQLLLSHSRNDRNRSTYGYLYTDPNPGTSFIPIDIPDWIRTSANHGEEIPVLLHGRKMMEHFDLINTAAYAGKWDRDEIQAKWILGQNPETESLSEEMIRYWSNFAKSGNPNIPRLTPSSSVWPKFSESTNKLMELKKNPQELITPRKEMLTAFDSVIMDGQWRRLQAEKITDSCVHSAKNSISHGNGSELTRASWATTAAVLTVQLFLNSVSILK